MEDYTDFCVEVIIKEAEKSKLDPGLYKTYVKLLQRTLSENFNAAYNRCAFMYLYATSHIYFVKDCIHKFLLECQHAGNLFKSWRSLSNVNFCSLSCGPALDYLSLMLAILETDTNPVEFSNVTVISKYIAWMDTVNFVSDSIQEGKIPSLQNHHLNFKDINVVEGNVLELFTDKMKEALENSNVIFMMQTLSSIYSYDESFMHEQLMELITHIKKAATIFFIDTLPNALLLIKVLCKHPGIFLYGPTYLRSKVPVTLTDHFDEIFGAHPVLSASGIFFVWQKLFSFPLLQSLNTTSLEDAELSKKACEINSDDLPDRDVKHRLSFSLGLSGDFSRNYKKFDITQSLNHPVLSASSRPEARLFDVIPNESRINIASSEADVAIKSDVNCPDHYRKVLTPVSIFNADIPLALNASRSSEVINSISDNEAVKLQNSKNWSPFTVSQRLLSSTPSSEQLSRSSMMTKRSLYQEEDDGNTDDEFDLTGFAQRIMKLQSEGKDMIDLNQNFLMNQTSADVSLSNSIGMASVGSLQSHLCAFKNSKNGAHSDLVNQRHLIHNGLGTAFPSECKNPSCHSVPPNNKSYKKRDKNKKSANNTNKPELSFQAVEIQENPMMETRSGGNHNSIQSLTERIGKLVASIEQEVVEQKLFNHHEARVRDCHICCNQQMNCYSPIHSNGTQITPFCFHSGYNSKDDGKALSDGKEPRRGNCSCNLRCKCHQRRFYPFSHSPEFIQCCLQRFHVPTSCDSLCKHSCVNNVLVPKLVIPLQSISNDVLLQIISILQTRSQSS